MKVASTAKYRLNRARFPIDELRKVDGKWVAFSNDGQRIVATGSDIVELAAQVRVANLDLEDVVLERIEIESGDTNVGGAEFL
jgi:hypothetical protein